MRISAARCSAAALCRPITLRRSVGRALTQAAQRRRVMQRGFLSLSRDSRGKTNAACFSFPRQPPPRRRCFRRFPSGKGKQLFHESGHKAAEITPRDEAHAARRWTTTSGACSSAIEDENDADERRVILASPQQRRSKVIVIPPPRKMRLSPHRFMRRWFKFTSVQILATIACLVLFNAVQAGAQSLASKSIRKRL